MVINSTIGKCCYCGQKVLLEKSQILKCDSCGAPLTQFKAAHAVKPNQAALRQFPTKMAISKPTKKIKFKDTHRHIEPSKRRKKTQSKWNLERFFDLAEDIVDIFD